MMAMQLSEVAQVLQAPQNGEDTKFCGVSTDTRTLEKRNLYVALKGPNFDGHAFLSQALDQGAVAAVVSRSVSVPMPHVTVPDTRLALGALAQAWRKRFSLPVLGITGSNGKSTVKEMCAAILGCRGNVLATQGNLNNEIGVPLTLFHLADEHQYAVIELGANHPGEIGNLAAIAKPAVGVITNATAAHLKGFGSVEGVARAKGELILSLAVDSTAVINADDPFAPLWLEFAGQRTVRTFGMDHGADIWGQWQAGGTVSRLRIVVGGEEIEVALTLPGRHNAVNALAATAACMAAGATLIDVQQGLQSLHPMGGRLNVHQLDSGITVIDDTYNANPASLQAALQVLADGSGDRWLVLGDMGELGEGALELHRQAGRQARTAGVTRLYTLGDLAAEAALAFGAGGRGFDDREALLETLKTDLRPSVTVLIKGSRAMAMEQVVKAVVPGTGGVGG